MAKKVKPLPKNKLRRSVTTLRLPVGLLREISHLAQAEGRSRSNYIEHVLTQLAQDKHDIITERMAAAKQKRRESGLPDEEELPRSTDGLFG